MNQINHISQIDTTLAYGKLLVAAITMLSSESLMPKSYDEVIVEVSDLATHMYGELSDKPEMSY